MAGKEDFFSDLSGQLQGTLGQQAGEGAGGLLGKAGGILGAIGPWAQAATFVFNLWGSAKEKEKARRAQYQQVDVSERSETFPVPLAYGRVKLRAAATFDRVSNEFHYRAPDSSRGADEFVEPGTNDQKPKFGNRRDLRFDTNALDHIAFNEFLLMQYSLCDAGEGGIEQVVDLDVDGVQYGHVAFKYGQRLHAYYQQGGAVADPLATANGAPSTNRFSEAAYITGAFRLNVNPFDGGNKGFYKRVPPLDGYLWSRRVRTVSNGQLSSAYTYSNNSMRVLLDIMLETGYPLARFDLASVESAITLNETGLHTLPGLAGFSPYRNGRVWGKEPTSPASPWLLDSVPQYQSLAPLPSGASSMGDVRRDWLRFEQNDAAAGFATVPATGVGVFAARGRYWKFNWSAVTAHTAASRGFPGDDSFGSNYAPGASVPVRLVPLSAISLAYGTGDTSASLRGLQEGEGAYVRKQETRTADSEAAVRLGEFNGWFNPFTPVREMIRQALAVMPWTKMVWSSGRLKFPSKYPVTRAQENALVRMTLTDEHILDLEKHYAPVDVAFNQHSITHADEEEDFAEITDGWPAEGGAVHAELLAKDGGIRSDRTVQLLGVSTPYHRDLLNEYNVRHSREVPAYRIAATMAAYALEPGDLVDVDSNRYGADRVEITEATRTSWGDVSAMVLSAVAYDYQNNPAAMPDQSDVRPPRLSVDHGFLPTGFDVALDSAARTLGCTWDDASVARWSIEAVIGDGDLTGTGADAVAFKARTDFAEVWQGRDNQATLPLPNTHKTLRLRLRGLTAQGGYTLPSAEVVVEVDAFVVSRLNLNTVYVRSATKPDALATGPAAIPTGTFDDPPTDSTDQLWANNGTYDGTNWVWDGWVQAFERNAAPSRVQVIDDDNGVVSAVNGVFDADGDDIRIRVTDPADTTGVRGHRIVLERREGGDWREVDVVVHIGLTGSGGRSKGFSNVEAGDYRAEVQTVPQAGFVESPYVVVETIRATAEPDLVPGPTVAPELTYSGGFLRVAYADPADTGNAPLNNFDIELYRDLTDGDVAFLDTATGDPAARPGVDAARRAKRLVPDTHGVLQGRSVFYTISESGAYRARTRSNNLNGKGAWGPLSDALNVSVASTAAAYVGAFFIYKRSATPVATTDRPSGSATVDLSAQTITLASSDANGWSTTVPSGTGTLYERFVIVTSTTAAATVAPALWGQAVITGAGRAITSVTSDEAAGTLTINFSDGSPPVVVPLNDGKGFQYAGAWTTSHTGYRFEARLASGAIVTDVVRHNGSSWVALQSHDPTDANAPGSSDGAAFWGQWSAKGEDGTDGIDGLDGKPGIRGLSGYATSIRKTVHVASAAAVDTTNEWNLSSPTP